MELFLSSVSFLRRSRSGRKRLQLTKVLQINKLWVGCSLVLGKLIMSSLDLIYKSLDRDPLELSPHPPHPSLQYSPWNWQDPEKSQRPQRLCKRPLTTDSSRKSRSSFRSDTPLSAKQPLRGTNYAFELKQQKHPCFLSTQPPTHRQRLSTPTIKPKRESSLLHHKPFRPSTHSFTHAVLDSYDTNTNNLFLFKPKNPMHIDIRNRNIQVLRHIAKKKFFKGGCTTFDQYDH